jgi:PIN domain nuclease of toxin-antitoxin system
MLSEWHASKSPHRRSGALHHIIYLSEKNRIPIRLGKALEKLNTSENYSIVDLTPEIVGVAEQIQFPDIFDRLIMATAQYLGSPVLTGDQDVTSKNVVETIWK